MEFYEVNTQAESQGRARYEWVRWGIIGFLGVIVTIVAVMLLQRGAESRVQMTALRNEIAECADAQCEFSAAVDLSQDSRDASLCQVIEKTEGGTANCIKEYAYDFQDPGACSLLRGTQRQNCEDNAWYLKASEDRDIALCGNIVGDLRDVCANELIATHVVLQSCASAGDFVSVCEQKVRVRLDVARQIGPELCAPFLAKDPELGEDGEEYGICLSVLDTVDLDGDGLTIREEIELGTDNQNPDTDGDGFDDGTEVRSGYNPLGE